jgi:hypothetical protein
MGLSFLRVIGRQRLLPVKAPLLFVLGSLSTWAAKVFREPRVGVYSGKSCAECCPYNMVPHVASMCAMAGPPGTLVLAGGVGDPINNKARRVWSSRASGIGHGCAIPHRTQSLKGFPMSPEKRVRSPWLPILTADVADFKRDSASIRNPAHVTTSSPSDKPAMLP